MIGRVLFFIFTMTVGGFAQVPVGDPYDENKHPNPIVTFVEIGDFKPSTYDTARARASIELMGLSQDEGQRESLEITESDAREVKILGKKTETLFYPVVRQTFTLTGGDSFVLYSFKDPRPDVPSEYRVSMLNEHAFKDEKKEKDRRFGASSPPEKLEIRGSPALLFDNDGELVLFWQGRRVAHVAVSSIDRETLFRLVDNLL